MLVKEFQCCGGAVSEFLGRIQRLLLLQFSCDDWSNVDLHGAAMKQRAPVNFVQRTVVQEQIGVWEYGDLAGIHTWTILVLTCQWKERVFEKRIDGGDPQLQHRTSKSARFSLPQRHGNRQHLDPGGEADQRLPLLGYFLLAKHGIEIIVEQLVSFRFRFGELLDLGGLGRRYLKGSDAASEPVQQQVENRALAAYVREYGQ